MNLLKKQKKQGIYRKASVLLKDIATSRIFQDGHHRTSYVVVKTFLKMNGADFKGNDPEKIITFIKNIRTYSIDEIERWLNNGEL